MASILFFISRQFKKISIGYVLVMAITTIPLLVFAQNRTGDNVDIRIMPSERFSGPIQHAGCMTESGERGCYIVLIHTPNDISISYSEQMLSEISNSVRSLTNIISRTYSPVVDDASYMVYSIIVPASGARLNIEDEESGVAMSHTFPPDESGQVNYFQVTKTGGSGEDDMVAGNRVIANPDGVILDSNRRQFRNRHQQEEIPAATDQPEVNEIMYGSLTLSADVDAEILINSESQGIGNVDLTLEPGMYQVEMVHQLGSETFDIEVEAGEYAQRSITFLPDRSTAIGLSAIIPGGGHIYTKRNYGYVYLAGALASAAFATYSFIEYRSFDTEHQNAIINYQNANSIDAANRYRADVENSYQNLLSAREHAFIGLGVFGAVYLIQLADISLTNPPFGYRSESGNNFSAGITNGGFSLRYRF